MDSYASRPVDELTPEDFEAHPVWEYDLHAEASPDRDETYMVPLRRYPVNDLGNRVIGTRITLNCGAQFPATLSNVSLRNARRTREFLFLSLWHNGQWIHLARYFDVDYDQQGPEYLASQLGLSCADVFPISYDISAHAEGADAVLRGTIEAEPGDRLSDEDRMALIFEDQT